MSSVIATLYHCHWKGACSCIALPILTIKNTKKFSKWISSHTLKASIILARSNRWNECKNYHMIFTLLIIACKEEKLKQRQKWHKLKNVIAFGFVRTTIVRKKFDESWTRPESNLLFICNDYFALCTIVPIYLKKKKKNLNFVVKSNKAGKTG